MSTAEIHDKVTTLLKTVPGYAPCAGLDFDSRTGQTVGSMWEFIVGNGLRFYSGDLYHFEKYGDPLPEGVFEWAIEQINKGNTVYKDSKKQIVKFLTSLPAEITDEYVYDTVSEKYLKEKLKRYSYDGYTWTNSDVFHFDQWHYPLNEGLYHWAYEQVEDKC